MTNIQTMKQESNKAIVEMDVAFQHQFNDVDPVLYGKIARLQPTPSSEWIEFDCHDFLHWLSDTNRIDAFCEGIVIRKGYALSDEVFWHEIVRSFEADSLLSEYLTTKELAA